MDRWQRFPFFISFFVATYADWIAQSFKHNQTWQGRQVCRPAQTRETNSSPSSDQGNKFVAQLALIQYELGDKFVSQLGPQVCRPAQTRASSLSPISCQIRTKRLGLCKHQIIHDMFVLK
jgi:hypothetical protein